MGIIHKVTSTVEKFKGLEKRQSDLIDKPGYFNEMKNANIRASGSISKRKGWHTIAHPGYDLDETVTPILGLSTWRGKVGSTDVITSETLLVKKNLWKIQTEELTIQNISTSTTTTDFIYVTLSVSSDNEFEFTVQMSGAIPFSESLSLGTGKGHVNDKTVQELATWMNNLTTLDSLGNTVNIPVQMTGVNLSANAPAAFIIPFTTVSLPKTVSTTMESFYTTELTRGDTTYNYFEGLEAKYNANSPSFKNVSSAHLNNVTYFATGFDEICKYDGNKIYRAGLPQPGDITASLASNTDVSSLNIGVDEDNNADTNSYYMATYRHKDHNGNIIQSTQSAYAELTGNTAHNQGHRHLVEITIPTVQPGTGFNLDDIEMMLWRAPKTTTDDDVAAASFYQVTDENLSTGVAIKTKELTYAQWNPLGLTASDYVNVVADETDPVNTNWTYTLTNNFIPNDKTVSTVTYLDFLSDEEINNNPFITVADYAEGRHDLPPMCKYIATHQGCLVLANKNIDDAGTIIADRPSELFFSLIQFNENTGEIGTEYFPNNANSVILEGRSGGPITGIKTLKDNLYVFHEDTVSLLSGDIGTLNGQSLRQDLLSSQGEMGSLSSHALQEYEGSLTFLSEDGLMTISNSKPFPQDLGRAIKPLLIDRDVDKRASVSFYTADDDVMGFMLPIRDNTYPDDIFVDSKKSVTYVYDVKNTAWHRWTNVDISGGIVRSAGKTYFVSRNNGEIYLNVFKKNDSVVDFADHEQPIDFEVITAWDSLGDPAVFKKYIRMKLLITDSNEKFDGGSFTLDMYLRRDFSDLDIGPIQFDSTVLGGWGTGRWGEFPWGDRPFTSVGTKLFGKARSICFKFTNNNLNENVLLTGFTMEVASPYKPEIKE